LVATLEGHLAPDTLDGVVRQIRPDPDEELAARLASRSDDITSVLDRIPVPGSGRSAVVRRLLAAKRSNLRRC
jgi:hypothetical protein